MNENPSHRWNTAMVGVLVLVWADGRETGDVYSVCESVCKRRCPVIIFPCWREWQEKLSAVHDFLPGFPERADPFGRREGSGEREPGRFRVKIVAWEGKIGAGSVTDAGCRVMETGAQRSRSVTSFGAWEDGQTVQYEVTVRGPEMSFQLRPYFTIRRNGEVVFNDR
jgi:hypothetical protein